MGRSNVACKDKYSSLTKEEKLSLAKKNNLNKAKRKALNNSIDNARVKRSYTRKSTNDSMPMNNSVDTAVVNRSYKRKSVSSSIPAGVVNNAPVKRTYTRWRLRALSTAGGELSLSEIHTLNEMTLCHHCGAKKFQFESPNFCCDNGRIKFAPVLVPSILKFLYTDQSAVGVAFRTNIRALNSMFSFTSFGAPKLDKDIASSRKGVYTFRVQGLVYHHLHAMNPGIDKPPCNFQLYFLDTQHEIQNRLRFDKRGDISEDMVNIILKVMERNPYAQLFRSLQNFPDINDLHLHISTDVKLDQRVYNAPTVDQVAAIWVEGNNAHVPIDREIVVEK